MKKILVKHVGNMGDLVFLVPPALEVLKKTFSDSHVTVVTAWGFKNKRGQWGRRNQGGFCISLLMTNPHIDELVHWHDTALSLDKKICHEEGQRFATWNKEYYEQQKQSGTFDAVFELDFGLTPDANPIPPLYQVLGLPKETFSNYRLYFTDQDQQVAQAVMEQAPRPRIVFLESLAGTTTRGWDPGKIAPLAAAIRKHYQVDPFWFGAAHTPYFEGRPLTLRENIATLQHCDVGIGVLSGPLHFAVASGLPTITLLCDQPIERAAPAYFLNHYIQDTKRKHRTLLGPSRLPYAYLKNDQPSTNLTPAEKAQQKHRNWLQPGRQATKTCLAAITPEEVMTVLNDML